jgi:hypothetical protein
MRLRGLWGESSSRVLRLPSIFHAVEIVKDGSMKELVIVKDIMLLWLDVLFQELEMDSFGQWDGARFYSIGALTLHTSERQTSWPALS